MPNVSIESLSVCVSALSAVRSISTALEFHPAPGCGFHCILPMAWQKHAMTFAAAMVTISYAMLGGSRAVLTGAVAIQGMGALAALALQSARREPQ